MNRTELTRMSVESPILYYEGIAENITSTGDGVFTWYNLGSAAEPGVETEENMAVTGLIIQNVGPDTATVRLTTYNTSDLVHNTASMAFTVVSGDMVGFSAYHPMCIGQPGEYVGYTINSEGLSTISIQVTARLTQYS